MVDCERGEWSSHLFRLSGLDIASSNSGLEGDRVTVVSFNQTWSSRDLSLGIETSREF